MPIIHEMHPRNVYGKTDWVSLYSNMSLAPTEPHYIAGADLITLSCVLYRLCDSNTAVNISEVSNLTNRAIPEDYILANEIKSHFAQKLMVLTLRGTELTEFRKDLSILVNTDYSKNDYSYPNKFVGMAYRLPYFYHYDKELIKIFGGEYRKLHEVRLWPRNVTQLTFINKIQNHLKGDNAMFEYWFSDDRDDRILLKVDRKNPLLPVFDLIIKEPISVSGTFAPRYREELQFYEVRNWQFEI